MRNRLLASVAATALTAIASADISTSLVSVPNGLGPNTVTYDLTVHVTGQDHWTSSSLKATVIGATFFNHPAGGNSQPNPAFFGLFPTLAWDSFLTHPEAWPNTPGQGSPAGFGVPTFSLTMIDATWFDTPPSGGDGDWVVARMSIENLTPGWSATVQGAHTTVKGGSTLVPYSFVVPEPGAGTLLFVYAIAACAQRRRGEAFP